MFWHLSRTPLMLVAEPGTGRTKNASNALTTGSSTAKEFACLSQTNATPSIFQETVSLATKATT